LARRSRRRAVVVQSMNTVWFRRCLQSAVPCTLGLAVTRRLCNASSSTRPPWGARRAAASAQRQAGFAVAPCSPFRLAVLGAEFVPSPTRNRERPNAARLRQGRWHAFRHTSGLSSLNRRPLAPPAPSEQAAGSPEPHLSTAATAGPAS
jgi:hypothetical protein